MSMMRGTRTITREVAESMAKTVAGILSDLGASGLADHHDGAWKPGA